MDYKPFFDIAGNPIEEGDLVVYRVATGHGPRILDYGFAGAYAPELDMLEFKSRGLPNQKSYERLRWISRYRRVFNISKMT